MYFGVSKSGLPSPPTYVKQVKFWCPSELYTTLTDHDNDDQLVIILQSSPGVPGPRVSILKPPEKLSRKSEPRLLQAVKHHVWVTTDFWLASLEQYWPLIGLCWEIPASDWLIVFMSFELWPSPERPRVTKIMCLPSEALSVSGIRLWPNKCRHWTRTITKCMGMVTTGAQ